MKTITIILLLAGFAAGSPMFAAETESAAPANPPTAMPTVEETGTTTHEVSEPIEAATAAPTPDATKAVVADPVAGTESPTESADAATAAADATENVAPAAPLLLPNGEPGLRLNFRNAPLELVLNYLSEAAGFIIVLDAQVRGKVDVWSNTPLSKDEAVNLLNSVLNKNGYAAIQNGRTLTIVNKDEAKARDIPVRSGSNPDSIPRNDQMVTQIIPVRFVEAAQLIKDLQPLVSSQTTMTANEAGNAIVITDTQANIRRVAEVIQAIDSGAEDVTEVRVFHLKFADPAEMAETLASVFPEDSRSGSSQTPVQFGGGPFGGFRGFFGQGGRNNQGGNTGASSQNQRIKKRARVIAVPDPRTSSVIVSATKDLMDQISGMIEQLDSNPARRQRVYVYSLENADAQEVQSVLEDMFERNTTTPASRNNRGGGNQNSALQNRSTQNQNNSSGASTFGTRGVGGAAGGGGGGF